MTVMATMKVDVRWPTLSEMVEDRKLSGILSRMSSDSSMVGKAERFREEAVEAKIVAWERGMLAKIENRFKREEAIISAKEWEKVSKAASEFKIFERKLEEMGARALEKMSNKLASARMKAEGERASAEAKRGTAAADVAVKADFMRDTGRVKPPSKLCR